MFWLIEPDTVYNVSICAFTDIADGETIAWSVKTSFDVSDKSGTVV